MGITMPDKTGTKEWRYRLKAGGKWRCEDPLLIFSTDRVTFARAEDDAWLNTATHIYTQWHSLNAKLLKKKHFQPVTIG